MFNRPIWLLTKIQRQIFFIIFISNKGFIKRNCRRFLLLLYSQLEYKHTTEKSFRNLIKSTRNQIVFTISRLIWNRTDIRLVPNQSENGKYSLISVWLNKISKRFLCVRTGTYYKNKNKFLNESSKIANGLRTDCNLLGNGSYFVPLIYIIRVRKIIAANILLKS